MTDTKELKHAVVLSGGGADGAYEVGVMKALFSGKARYWGDLSSQISLRAPLSGLLTRLCWSRNGIDYGTAAIADLEHVWRETLADRPNVTGNGGYRFRLNPFDFLNPRNYFPNPFQPLLQLAEDSLYAGLGGPPEVRRPGAVDGSASGAHPRAVRPDQLCLA